MAFTANHYKEVARIIREERTDWARLDGVDEAEDTYNGAIAALRDVQVRLSQMFQRQNPTFDAPRFQRDCTPQQERT